MNIPDKIASLINENPDEVAYLDTPSQVFEQAVTGGGYDNPDVSLETAIDMIKDYAEIAGIGPLLVRDAIEYAKLRGGVRGAGDTYAEFDDDPELGPDSIDPDSLSDRGF